MRPFRRLGAVLALLLLLLLANLSWIQVLDADTIRQQPGNTRLLLEQFNRQRGPILVEAAPIASSARVAGEDFYQRSYSQGPAFAPVTGYYSPLYGATGIERAEDDVLSGRDARLFVDRVQQLFAGRQPEGGAVDLTLDGVAQVAAYRALGSLRGAVVALDASTGAVKVLASAPSFDPQVLAPNDPTRVRAQYARLVAAADRPLLNRGLELLYPADAAFPLVTVTAALRSGKFTVQTSLPATATWSADGTRVSTRDGRPCSGSGRITLADAMRTHCDTALAAVGATVGRTALQDAARRFGFGTTLATPLPAKRGSIGTAAAALLATGSGTRASALQLALLMSALADGGTVMRPYLVQDLRGPDLAPLASAQPRAIATPMTKRNAIALGRALLVSPTSSDCPRCTLPGHAVHALTGDGVFLAYSGSVAIAVVVEAPAGSGGGQSAIDVGMATLRSLLGAAA